MIDYCFYDTDFMMLDDYSAEDIVKSGVNDELGVYERLRFANIKGLPEIYHMEENDGWF